MSDEHGPKAGCKWGKCGVSEDAPNCPFTKFGRVVTESICHHEWRQHWTLDTVDGAAKPNGYYCIRCRTFEKN